MFNRELYLDQIKDYIDSPVIKIIKGIRRCGKSEILKLIIEELLNRKISDEQIIYLNYESMVPDDYRNHEGLYKYVQLRAQETEKKLYILLDEIQEVDQWERAIRAIRVDFNADIYLTGSNAKLLSDDLATFLSGRYIEFELFPLSFREFIEFYEFKYENHIADSIKFNDYIRFGGFPEMIHMVQKEEVLNNYLQGIYNTVVLKDVIGRNSIREPEQLQRVLRYLMDNIGEYTSGKKIADYLKGSNQEEASVNTVYRYLDAFEKALIIHSVKPYDLKGKKVLKRSEKIYLSDLGFKHAILGYRENDIAQSLENIVYLELRRRGYTVYVGKSGDYEVDFVATKNSRRIYFQVTYLLASEDTIEREYRALESIDDHFPKYILSLDQVDFGMRNGIIWLNIIDFLLTDKL